MHLQLTGVRRFVWRPDFSAKTNQILLCIVLAMCVVSLPLSAAVSLPLEVIGPDGTTTTATVQAPAGAQAQALWIQIHGLTYQEKASVQVNSGAWIPLRNDQPGLTIAQPGLGYGGIGGIFQTLKMTVSLPSGTTVDGANTIRFRLNQTDGTSISFRVLDFNLLDVGNTRLVAASEFVNENPDLWLPPSSAQADIDAGDNLWNNAPLITRPGGTSMQARCAMCHDPEGRDLKYFNYSNHSIIERSVFHGLSFSQSSQIASYIRTRQIKNPGRPWNPPYQPGPGLDAKPGDEWSAGAGLSAVIEDEHDMLPYLPGSGTDKSAFIDANRRITAQNRRELPVPLQYFDWNHWLPAKHPIDAAGVSAWNNSHAKQRYLTIRDGLLGLRGMTRAQYIRGLMRQEIDTWAGPDADGGIVFPGTAQQQYSGVYDMMLTNAVRMWGLSHEFTLHDLGEQFYGSQGEKRMFLTDRMIFNMSPAIIPHTRPADVNSTDPNNLRLVVDGTHREVLDDDGVTSLWYEMQTLLNGGQRNSFVGGGDDVDWMGNWFYVGANGGYRNWPINGLAMSWKSIQEIDGGFGPDGSGLVNNFAANSRWGFSLRDGRPELGHVMQRDWGPGWTVVQKRSLITPLYAAWVEKLATFEASSWNLSDNSVFNQHTDYVWGSSGASMSYPDILRAEIGNLRSLGVPDALTIALADHGAYVWPNNDWNGLKPALSSGLAAPIGVSAVAGPGRVSIQWSAVPGATSYNVLRAENAGAVFQTVSLMVVGTTAVDRLLTPDRAYVYRVSANQDSAVSAPSAAVTATVGRGEVLRYAFEESAGDRAEDTSGGEVWGKLVSNPQRTTARVGQGLALSGQTSYESNSFVSSSQNLNRWTGRSVTVSAWVRSAGGGTNDDATAPGLMGTWNDRASSSTSWMYVGGLNSAGQLTAKYWNGATATSSVGIADGTWHHVAMTRDETTGAIAFFVDGVAAGGGTSGTGYRPARAFGIGRIDATGASDWRQSYRYWPGSIDEVRIFNTVLTPSDIAALAIEGLPVNSPPTVTLTEPANLTTVTAVATITLTAVASDSDGSIAKVEFFNGATKVGEDALAPYQIILTGIGVGTLNLTARATDNAGATAVSAVAQVQVIAPPQPPVVTAQPMASVTVLEGQDATFAVTATGTGLSYQWRRNGIAITGATNATYVRSAASMADDMAVFSVVTTNGASLSTISAESVLHVTPAAPLITTQPASLNVLVGQDATFSVTATDSACTYQWLRNSTPISGAISASYLRAAAQYSDSGAVFSVVVTRYGVSTLSGSATLTVTAVPPVVTVPPAASVTVLEGQDTTFAVTATGTGLSYQWRRNGIAIAGIVDPTYVRPAVTMVDDAAVFSVVVTNVANQSVISADSVLHVTPAAPVITAQPTAQSVLVGQDATFTVTATGSASTYQWLRKGTPISGATLASYQVAAAQLTDSGAVFSVVVTRYGASTESGNATLTVTTVAQPPVVTTPVPGTVTVELGGDATLTVTVTGTGLTYQWKRDGVVIVGAVNATYVVTRVSEADDGAVFTVVITGTAPPAVTSDPMILRVTRSGTGSSTPGTVVVTSNDVSTDSSGGCGVGGMGTMLIGCAGLALWTRRRRVR